MGNLTPTTTGTQKLAICWIKSTSLTSPSNSHFSNATSKRHGPTGHGVRSVEGAGYTPSQITLWLGRGILGRGYRKVGFQSLSIYNSNHRAAVAHMWIEKGRSIKTYRRNRQCFPIKLPPGEEDKKTHLFEELKALCDHLDPEQQPRNNWISVKTWKLVADRVMLCRTGRLCQLGGRRMKINSWNSLKEDHIAQTK